MGSKKFFGAPENTNNWFSRKPEFHDLTEHGSHDGPEHPGALRPKYSIQKVATLLWPSVWNLLQIDIQNFFQQCLITDTLSPRDADASKNS